MGNSEDWGKLPRGREEAVGGDRGQGDQFPAEREAEPQGRRPGLWRTKEARVPSRGGRLRREAGSLGSA